MQHPPNLLLFLEEQGTEAFRMDFPSSPAYRGGEVQVMAGSGSELLV